MRILLRILSYTRPYLWAVFIAYAALIGTNVLSILVPQILQGVIDEGILSGDSNFMFQAGLLVVGLGVLRGFTGFCTRYFSEWLANRATYDMRNELYDHVLSLSFSYHDSAQTGQLITRAISDVEEIQRYIAYALVDGLNLLTLAMGIIGVMLFANVPLTVISILPLIPLFIIAIRLGRIIRIRFRTVMDHLSRLGEMLEENIVGNQVVRAFAREAHEIERFGAANQTLYDKRLHLIDTWTTNLPIMNFVTSLSTVLVLGVGGLMALDEASTGVTVGTVVAFNAWILMLAQPMQFFGFVIMLTTQAMTSGERIFEIMDAPVDIADAPNAQEAPPLNGEVRFEHVTFQYPGSEAPVLHEIDLCAREGQIVALLGATGSGKSTLINLIPRFYDVASGRILVDGRDVRELKLVSLRKQIGIVLQESLLFSATLEENIAFGRPDATREEVIAAAKAANAHDFIMEFPDGYETLVGERGVTLSGGQRQRVAIARALVMDPRILILDDSTSSVDTQTEFLIQEALTKLMQGRTTFVIAQRLTTVQNADQILVLDKGRIVEQGQHQELLANEGIYRDIYRLQLEDQERLRRELMVMGGLYEGA